MIIYIYLAAINLVAFCVMGWDKRAAKARRRRIPEKTLFLLAASGGSIGVWLAMRVFRHKTLHNSFRFGVPAILVLQLAAAVLLCRYLGWPSSDFLGVSFLTGF